MFRSATSTPAEGRPSVPLRRVGAGVSLLGTSDDETLGLPGVGREFLPFAPKAASAPLPAAAPAAAARVFEPVAVELVQTGDGGSGEGGRGDADADAAAADAAAADAAAADSSEGEGSDF